ncbi:hypothetical protein AYL99_12101 [Fonsecaea erecta]|uniref:Zn(2)-C6 fungal-type domain-containing protein n=1 Tax=Fonsecaea erecta TaxID=1367422 RepID=A0A178Z1Q2_9EURO|nr:hypothetical protein AYL99_12101 [Fonsecaea erecta]OAP53729.1 hypothetical protein AYL99_12101 [Fonsecaea erecta]
MDGSTIIINKQVQRRQMHSCDTCRRRKIKCDSVNKAHCTACRKSGVECRFSLTWKRHASRSVDAPVPSAASPSNSTDVVPQTTLEEVVPFTDNGATTPAPLESGRVVAPAPCNAVDTLSQFFHKGVWSSSWAEFDDYERLRLAYIGTSGSNFSHLVNLNREGQRFLTYPHPPIHPHLPWKPQAQHYLNKGPLLENVRQLSSFPAKEIRNELVEAFFEKIHPYFPVLDEADFRRQYKDPFNPPPLLLFQAVLLAGAHVCNHPRVANTRQAVKSILYHRVKILFDLRHENNRVHLVQAALLLTWHLEDSDSVSLNSYYWVGVACRIAFGIGLHRNLMDEPDIPGRMPACDRRLHRRVWWVLFQTEVMSALEHGRPSMINRDDYDQPPLELSDFCEQNGQINTRVNLEYCSRNIELCEMILEIQRATSPGAILRGEYPDVKSLNSRLIKWAIAVPLTQTFWSLQLQLHYQTVAIHLHRLYLDGAERIAQSPDSNDQCNAAAQMILSIFDAIIRIGVLQQCYFPSVVALIAAGVHVSRSIQQLVDKGSMLLALNSLRNLESVVHTAEVLKEFWPNAEGVEKLFRVLVDRYKDLLHREHRDEESTTTADFCNIDWETMLLFDSQPRLMELDWMDALSN